MLVKFSGLATKNTVIRRLKEANAWFVTDVSFQRPRTTQQEEALELLKDPRWGEQKCLLKEEEGEPSRPKRSRW